MAEIRAWLEQRRKTQPDPVPELAQQTRPHDFRQLSGRPPAAGDWRARRWMQNVYELTASGG